MQHRPLGSSGLSASIVAFGAWAIGGWRWGGTDEAASIRAIHAAIDHGINLIDTAPVYGFGLSESIVAKAVADRRDKVLLATKCSLICDPSRGVKHFRTNSVNFDEHGLIQVNRCGRPDSIRQEIEGSLARLKTDHIDLYQTHWQDPSTPISETMGELMRLKQQGKIRAIGCSNANCRDMDQYRAAGQLDSDQEKYSMLSRELEKGQLPYCLKHNVAVLAYSPLEQGLLTGKLTAGRQFAEGDLRKDNPKFGGDVRQRIAALLEKFEPVAKRHGITMTQLVIAWTLHQPGLTHALCGARTAEQAIENAKAGDVKLAAEDLAVMDQALAEHGG